MLEALGPLGPWWVQGNALGRGPEASAF